MLQATWTVEPVHLNPFRSFTHSLHFPPTGISSSELSADISEPFLPFTALLGARVDVSVTPGARPLFRGTLEPTVTAVVAETLDFPWIFSAISTVSGPNILFFLRSYSYSLLLLSSGCFFK